MKFTKKLTADQFDMIREDSCMIHDEKGRTFMFLPYWYEIKNTDEKIVLIHPIGDIPTSLQQAKDEMAEYTGSKIKPNDKLNVYKIRDCIDQNVAFVVADSIKRAYELINEQTTLECVYEDSKKASDFGKTEEGIWINDILPF